MSINIQVLGSINGTNNSNEAENRQLALEKFGGRVITSQSIVSQISCPMQTITDNKGYRFPIIGRAVDKPKENTDRENDIVATTFHQGDFLIEPDRRTETMITIDDFDQFLIHFDQIAVSQYSKRVGEEFALQEDDKIFRTAVKGARSAGRITGEPAGTVIEGIDLDNPETISQGILAGIYALKNKRYFTSSEEYIVYVKLEVGQALLNSSSRIMQREYEGTIGMNDHTVYRVHGMYVKESKNFTDTCDAAPSSTAYGGKYNVDLRNTLGLFYHKTESVIGVIVGSMKMKHTEAEKAFRHNVLFGLQTGYNYYISGRTVELSSAVSEDNGDDEG